MVQALKSEIRKLLSVRSTYILTLIVVILTGFFTYAGTTGEYAQSNCPEPKVKDVKLPDGSTKTEIIGKECPPPVQTKNVSSGKLKDNIDGTVLGVSLFAFIVVVLFMAHEYRYNTIMYSLTLSKSRNRVLGSKVAVAAGFVVVLTLLAIGLCIAATYTAVSVKGLIMPGQNIDWVKTIGDALFYTLGVALLGLAIITLIRNLAAGIVSVFVLSTIDQILSGILITKYDVDPARYLPFSALTRVVSGSGSVEVGPDGPMQITYASAGRAAITFLTYFVLVWAVSWYLFLRRDAA